MPQVHPMSVMRDPEPVIEPAEFRHALGCFATGVAVVTTLGDRAAPVSMTINSFNSVSLTPPLILWSLARSAQSFAAFCEHGGFAINVLADDQLEFCKQFARPSSNKFAGIRYRRGYMGVPLIKGAAARLECRAYARYPGGDYQIHVGEVVSISASEKPPLVFHRGQFTTLPGNAGQAENLHR